MRDEIIGERLHRLVREGAGMRPFELADLCADGLDHVRMPMPEAGNRRTATGVEKASSMRIDDVDAVTGDRVRIIRGQAAVEHEARLGTHCGSPDVPINAAGQSSSGYAK